MCNSFRTQNIHIRSLERFGVVLKGNVYTAKSVDMSRLQNVPQYIFDKKTRLSHQRQVGNGFSYKQHLPEQTALIGVIPTVRGVSPEFIMASKTLVYSSEEVLSAIDVFNRPTYDVFPRQQSTTHRTVKLINENPSTIILSESLFIDDNGDIMRYVDILDNIRNDLKQLAKEPSGSEGSRRKQKRN